MEIIQRAIRRPAKTIANNAGLEGDVIVGKLLEKVGGGVGCIAGGLVWLVGGVPWFAACDWLAHCRPTQAIPPTSSALHAPSKLPHPWPPTRVQEGDEDVGFNAAAGRFENMVAAGIIDPMKARRAVLCCAVLCCATHPLPPMPHMLAARQKAGCGRACLHVSTPLLRSKCAPPPHPAPPRPAGRADGAAGRRFRGLAADHCRGAGLSPRAGTQA